MRKRTRKIGVLLLNSILSFNMTGCLKSSEKIRSNKYFNYVIFGENLKNQKGEQTGYVIITGFTKLGHEQERLDIPREIEGYPVTRIGRKQQAWTISLPQYNVVFPQKLKKLFVFDTLEYCENCSKSKELDVFYCDDYHNRYDFEFANRLFVYNLAYHFNYDDPPESIRQETLELNSHLFLANITFMNNYPLEDNGGHYRLDNVEKDEKLIEPPAPELEGYTFTGWYTEEECIYKYDFNTSLDIELGDEMVLYAGWKANA